MVGKKFSFRQRWFPTVEEAEDLTENRKGSDYSSLEFPVIDFFGRWVRTIALGLTLLGTGCQTVGNNRVTEQSTYNGVVTSFGKEGLFWKTYEGSLAVGGEQRSVSTTFSLDNHMDSSKRDSLVSTLQEAVRNQTPVRINGAGYLATWPWRAGTRYLIQTVEPLSDK